MNSYLPTKLDSLEEINVFLSAYSLPRLKQEEIDNLKKPNTSKEIDFVNKLKKKKKKKTSNQQESRSWWLPKGSLPTIWRINIYYYQSITKNWRG